MVDVFEVQIPIKFVYVIGILESWQMLKDGWKVTLSPETLASLHFRNF